MTKPVQKILFGSPGTGKSHKIKNIFAAQLEVEVSSENYIPTVFHPEYTYGDFMGKLMPFTNDSGKVEYLYYRGHFMKALAQSYKNIILTYIDWEEKKEKLVDEYKKEIEKSSLKNFTSAENSELDARKNNIIKEQPKNVILVIDEINRGNSAAIFGSVFQLLDREESGWSTYAISISDLEFKGLLQEMSFVYEKYQKTNSTDLKETYSFNSKEVTTRNYQEYQSYIFEEIGEQDLARERKIKIPANLSVIATMNTSDNSIYFMDSAFKRRWDWEFVEIEDKAQRDLLMNVQVILENGSRYQWTDFVDKLNEFIKNNHEKIKKIEDKQVGYRFINEKEITEENIKNKLMFFLWDSVFGNNKDPLIKLLFGDSEHENRKKLVTFGDFSKMTSNFVIKIVSNSF